MIVLYITGGYVAFCIVWATVWICLYKLSSEKNDYSGDSGIAYACIAIAPLVPWFWLIEWFERCADEK